MSAANWLASHIPAIGNESRPPDAEGTADAFAQSGYKFEHAIADLVDNCVDAHAVNVLIRFVTLDSTLEQIIIADDGAGMSEDRLSEAMRYGARVDRERTALGKFGVGMKSASRSQCRDLSVITIQSGIVSGRRWTAESIKQGWKCEILDPEAAFTYMDRDWGSVAIGSHGTLVVWDGLDRLRASGATLESSLDSMFKNLRTHLGLVFHRFIQAGSLRIYLDRVDGRTWQAGLASSVEELDPFGYERSGAGGYPKTFDLELGGGTKVAAEAFIWPPKSKAPEYRLGGGRVASRQGFYFYRHDRLIQAGSWNGWRDNDSEPHLSLARIRVDLPRGLDRLFGLNLHKSQIDVPPAFLPAIDATRNGSDSFQTYIQRADEVYRNAKLIAADRQMIPVPGPGLPMAVRVAARRVLTGQNPNIQEVPVTWQLLPSTHVFDLDRDDGAIVLNSRYRRQLTGQSRATRTDGPVFKTLAFMLLKEYVMRERLKMSTKVEVAQINDILLAAVRATNGA